MIRCLFLCLAIGWTSYVEAVTIVIGSPPRPRLSLRIGSGGGTVDTVSFAVPFANIGDGTPVTGTPAIGIRVIARAAPANSRVAVLTVDSSASLTNGIASAPMSSIGWTASDSDIPSGTFDGSPSQVLVSFMNSRRISVTHTFSYANDILLDAGTYTGRVSYTLSMP